MPAREYVAGAGGTGHVHVFAGGETGGGGFGGGGAGRVREPRDDGRAGQPTNLWASQSQLMPYDVVLLSCEGGETYNANPPALESYLNAGGRAFGVALPLRVVLGPHRRDAGVHGARGLGHQPRHVDGQRQRRVEGTDGGTPIGGTIVTTLNGSTQTFAKGQASTSGSATSAPSARTASRRASCRFISRGTTPRSGPRTSRRSRGSRTTNRARPGRCTSRSTRRSARPRATTNETGPTYCGRAVYSDLHVAGNP